MLKSDLSKNENPYGYKSGDLLCDEFYNRKWYYFLLKGPNENGYFLYLDCCTNVVSVSFFRCRYTIISRIDK